jgi:hypothetical protein
VGGASGRRRRRRAEEKRDGKKEEKERRKKGKAVVEVVVIEGGGQRERGRWAEGGRWTLNRWTPLVVEEGAAGERKRERPLFDPEASAPKKTL